MEFLDFVTEDNFDEEYYLTIYPDVKKAVEDGVFSSGLNHYLLWGYTEGRCFIAGFNDVYYQKCNPDVKRAVREGYFKCGLDHYLRFGIFEKRLVDASRSKNKYEQLIINSAKRQNVPLKVFKS